jgi:hypothetical protein
MSFQVSTQPLPVQVNGASLKNEGPGTLYYRDEAPVTSAVNDGSVAAGSAVTLAGTQYLVTTTACAVSLRPAASSPSFVVPGSNIPIRTSEVPVGVHGSVVRNAGPGVLYYRDRSPVSATLNDGSIASGSTATLEGMQYFVSASTSTVTIYGVAGVSPDLLGTDVLTLINSGGWTWYNEPRAVCYAGTTRKLYVGNLLMKAGGDVAVTSIDLASGARRSFTLAENLQADDHNNPAFIVRPDGRLIAFYSAHGDTAIRWRISTNPEDVTAWGSEQTISEPDTTSYANVFMLSSESNRIYLLHRRQVTDGINGHKPHIRWSDDNGATFSSPLPVFYGATGLRVGGVGGSRPYVRYASNNAGRIHVCASSGHPRSTDETPASTCHMWHWYMEGGNFYKSDGTLIRSVASLGTTGPLAEAEVTKIFDADTDSAGDGNAWPYSIELDGSGRPVVTFGAFVAAADNRYWYARWTGSAWDKHEILASQGTIPSDGVEQQYAGLCVVDPRNTNRIWVSKQTDATAVWEIERWTTADGGANWDKVAVTTTSATKNVRPYVPANWISGAPSVLWQAGTYTNFINYALCVKALGSDVVYPDSFSLTDTFTGADGTQLVVHPADTGQAWTHHPAGAVAAALLQGNRLQGGAPAAHEIVVPGPLNRRLRITGDVVLITDNNSATIGPTALNDPLSLSYLAVRYNTSTNLWEAFKFIEGTGTSLGTSAVGVGSFEWLIDETGFTFAIAGTVRITAAASAYAEVSAPGAVGVRATGTHGAAVGVHLDNFHVESL